MPVRRLRLTTKLLFIAAALLPRLLNGNPPPSEWQIITPTDAGAASGSAYFPMEGAFDGSVTWNTSSAEVSGSAGTENAPPYTDRHGYIDFGPDYDQVHIMECWSRYRTYSGGSQPGYAEMWWDDDKDNINDDGIAEDRLNFNSGQGVPHINEEIWFRDKRINDLGGVRPAKRYLILKSTSTYAERCQEYAIVGFLYDGLVPPEYANLPRLEIDNNTVRENTNWQQSVGTLSITGGEAGETYTLEYDPDLGDNDAFQLDGMTLWTTRSYDFEAQSRYQLNFDVVDSSNNRTRIELEIEIEDQSGAFDTNGVATAAVAAAYPEINEGDYVIWNATSSSGPHISLNSFNIVPPNKILIKAGNYASISLTLDGVNGTGPENRVPITNFLGQVYTNSFKLSNGSYWRLTGQYVPTEGLGHADFTGCDGPDGEEQFGFSNGSYGIWVSNEWVNESSSLVYVGGTATGWEIDHIEASDGGFAGMLLKRDDNDSMDMDDVYLHHLYIHDTGSEGIYLGSTQTDPQHQFNNLLIENIVILRTGTEAIQAGQLGNNCLIQNSVFWGAMDWLSPFQRYQDNCAQVAARQGNVTFRNNVLLGAGEKFFNTSVTAKDSITPNGLPITFENNLMWGCNGPLGAYQFKNSDNTTPWIWKDNYWGGFVYNYDLVYPSATDSGTCVAVATNGTTVDCINNIYDNSRDRIAQNWAGSTSTINETGSTQQTLPEPIFENLTGSSGALNILKWTRWTATIGEASTFPGGETSNKGDPVSFNPGDIVQHDNDKRTRFYRCLQSNSQHEPPLEGDSTWELLTWTSATGKTQYCPPDDVRLAENCFYQQLGMGLSANTAPVAEAQTLTTDINAPRVITLTGSDNDGDQLNYQLESEPSKGELSGTAPDLIYTPDNNFTGIDSFSFIVNDGQLDSTEATVSITVANPAADIIAGYDFDDGSGAPSRVVTVKDTWVTASDFSVGEGLIDAITNSSNSLTELTDAEGNLFGTANSLSYGGAQSTFGFTDMANGNKLETAISNHDYMTFTVTPAEGYKLNLSRFNFRTRVNQLNNSAERWALFTSVDGFNNGAQTQIGRTTHIATWSETTNNISIDLTDPKFQNLADPVTFRLYIYGGNNNGSSATIFDKLILHGQVTEITEYDEWAFTHDLSGADLLPDADSIDQDGIPNALEAWFGTSPREANSTGLAIQSTNKTTTTFTHPQNETPPAGLSAYYEWSPDLIEWYHCNGVSGPVDGLKLTATPQTNGQITTVSITANQASERIFLRARVEQN
jgi:hypothetical protein